MYLFRIHIINHMYNYFLLPLPLLLTSNFSMLEMLLVNFSYLQDASFVFGAEGYNNDTGFSSVPFVCLIGSLAAASTFTGYDTAAHIAEETEVSHISTPYAMIGSTINALITGKMLSIYTIFSFCSSLSFYLPINNLVLKN